MWCWEMNPGPLEEQPVLLTAEPSLWPIGLIFVVVCLGFCFVHLRWGSHDVALAGLELTEV